MSRTVDPDGIGPYPMNYNDDSDESQDSGSEASSRGALLQAKGGSKHDGRGGKSKRKAKKMPMV